MVSLSFSNYELWRDDFQCLSQGHKGSERGNLELRSRLSGRVISSSQIGVEFIIYYVSYYRFVK